MTGIFSLLAIITRMPGETYRRQFVLLLFSCYTCDVKPALSALSIESIRMVNLSVPLNLLVRWSLLTTTKSFVSSEKYFLYTTALAVTKSAATTLVFYFTFLPSSPVWRA